MKGRIKTFLLLAILNPPAFSQTVVELAGNPVNNFPYFHWVQNFNSDEEVSMAIDGKLHPAINAVTANVFVVNHKTVSEWLVNDTLIDITNGGEQSCTFSNTGIQQNTFQLATPGELVAYNSIRIGVKYDIVIDVDNNGILSPADFIDGGNAPGLYVIRDITQPGSLAVSTVDWTQDTTLAKRMWYPANISTMNELPLIVISHGWTYNYTHYDYIGEHLASYGYIVMSHWNDVGNGDPDGTNTASLSLIEAIDHLIANQDTLFGGVLNGKIDHHHMGWLGHSTGGESPVRAYTRLHNGENASAYFSWNDVSFISSLCPVSWFPDSVVNPYNVNYHQFLGGADTDVSGFPSNNYWQPLTIYERGKGNKHVIYVHGAGHGVFNTDSLNAFQWQSGPDLINRAQLHPVVKAYLLAMAELYCKQNFAGQEFFSRSYTEYHPMNIDSAVVITNEFKEAQSLNKRVIDDFETNDTLTLASSNAIVTSNLQNSYELLMQDFDQTFHYFPLRPSNGMTRARFTDSPHCLVIEWDSAGFVRYVIPDSLKDFSDYAFLSLRACQRTQHPFNVTLDSSINFVISVTDEAAHTASVMIEDYGPVIQTYQRSSGWQNEFCTIRIRLSDFLVNGTQLDLSAIESLEFSFGTVGTSPTGALGIDDIELVNNEITISTQVQEMPTMEANPLRIYPNPSTGKIKVLFEKTILHGKIEIFNMMGEILQTENMEIESKLEMNLTTFSSGIYFVKVNDGHKQYFTKIIIE